MGGYSRRCALCGKWFTNPQALKDHGRGKHGLKWPEFEPHTDWGAPLVKSPAT